jgi:hypothetical protein
VPDPSGGTFDAAGDFDRFLTPDSPLPVLSSIDPFAVTQLTSADMPGLLHDLDAAESEAKGGPEGRGLARLRVLAERCSGDDRLLLVFVGD